MIDYIFNLVTEKSNKIPRDFILLIERLELNYTKEIISRMNKNKVLMFKIIIYVLYELDKENFRLILNNTQREELIVLYDICITHHTDDLIAYYKKAIINKYARNCFRS